MYTEWVSSNITFSQHPSLLGTVFVPQEKYQVSRALLSCFLPLLSSGGVQTPQGGKTTAFVGESLTCTAPEHRFLLSDV